MKRLVCTALIAIAVVTGSANAADLDRGGSKDEFPYAPATSWAGFYAGGHVGVTLDDEVLFSSAAGGNFLAGFGTDEALMAGVHIGYAWQTPSNWVYGIEADLGIIDDELVVNELVAENELKFELTDYLTTVRGRLGIANGDSLLYATAGVAFLSYDDEAAEQLGDTAFGLVVGAGYERKFGRNFSLGVEGLYYDLASDVDLDGEKFDVDRDFWAVRARATYHFDREYVGALK